MFVLSGTSTYAKLEGLVAPGATEDGSDGTVRAASASLDSVRIVGDFRLTTPNVTLERQPNGRIAFKLVEGLNHSEIVPRDDPAHPAMDIILRCLAVKDGADYARVEDQFNKENADFYERQKAQRPRGIHRYQQFIVRVLDDMEVEVDDYQLSFHVVDDAATVSTWKDGEPGAELKRYQQYTTRLRDTVIVHVQPHTVRPSYRTFFIDLDEKDALEAELRQLPQKPFIAMNIDAISPTPNVSFDTDDLHYVRLDQPIKEAGNGRTAEFFWPNTSTLVDIYLRPRMGREIFDFPES